MEYRRQLCERGRGTRCNEERRESKGEENAGVKHTEEIIGGETKSESE